jgi:hypothetical protein
MSETKIRECKSCKRKGYQVATNSKDWGFCRNPECQAEQSMWVRRNFDQLPEGAKMRNQHERPFWELNDIQREKYATFFALMRPKKERKKRRCLGIGCNEVIDNKWSTYEDRHLCSQCSYKNEHIGALASY